MAYELMVIYVYMALSSLITAICTCGGRWYAFKVNLYLPCITRFGAAGVFPCMARFNPLGVSLSLAGSANLVV
jgi:hypothetical protein